MTFQYTANMRYFNGVETAEIFNQTGESMQTVEHRVKYFFRFSEEPWEIDVCGGA
jgi:hypothetical protein